MYDVMRLKVVRMLAKRNEDNAGGRHKYKQPVFIIIVIISFRIDQNI